MIKIIFQSESTPVSLIKSNILRLFVNGVPNIAVSKDQHLKLLNKGRLAETDHALVWKGEQISDHYINLLFKFIN